MLSSCAPGARLPPLPLLLRLVSLFSPFLVHFSLSVSPSSILLSWTASFSPLHAICLSLSLSLSLFPCSLSKLVSLSCVLFPSLSPSMSPSSPSLSHFVSPSSPCLSHSPFLFSSPLSLSLSLSLSLRSVLCISLSPPRLSLSSCLKTNLFLYFIMGHGRYSFL